MLGPTHLQRPPAEEYFQGTSGVGSAVTVDPPELLFHGRSRSLSVSVTNRTKGTLSLAWTAAPGWAFSVEPASRDLAPLKSTAFQVVYAPLQDNALHGAQLECFAFYKVSPGLSLRGVYVRHEEEKSQMNRQCPSVSVGRSQACHADSLPGPEEPSPGR